MAKSGKEMLQEDIERRLAAAEDEFRTAALDIVKYTAAVVLWTETGYQGELLYAMQELHVAQDMREEAAEVVGRLQHALEVLKDLDLD